MVLTKDDDGGGTHYNTCGSLAPTRLASGVVQAADDVIDVAKQGTDVHPMQRCLSTTSNSLAARGLGFDLLARNRSSGGSGGVEPRLLQGLLNGLGLPPTKSTS